MTPILNKAKEWNVGDWKLKMRRNWSEKNGSNKRWTIANWSIENWTTTMNGDNLQTILELRSWNSTVLKTVLKILTSSRSSSGPLDTMHIMKCHLIYHIIVCWYQGNRRNFTFSNVSVYYRQEGKCSPWALIQCTSCSRESFCQKLKLPNIIYPSDYNRLRHCIIQHLPYVL